MEIGVSQRQRIAGANRHRGPAVQPLRVHQGVPSPASTAPRVWCFKRIKVPTGTERHDVICLICIMHYFFLYIYIHILYILYLIQQTFILSNILLLFSSDVLGLAGFQRALGRSQEEHVALSAAF